LVIHPSTSESGELSSYKKEFLFKKRFLMRCFSFRVEYYVPIDDASKIEQGSFLPSDHKFYGSGDVRTATTHVSDIGKFVARIIDDLRTLNRNAFIYGDQKSQNETWDIVKKVKKEVRGD